MSELEEIKERMREEGAKPPKRKIGKKGKTAIIATVLVIAILIGVYVAMILMTPPPEKYWKPEKEFKMPDVEWSAVNKSFTLRRGFQDLDPLNKSIGGSKSNMFFSVLLYINIIRYEAHTDGTGYIDLFSYIHAQNLREGNYIIKSLEFRFDYGNDSNVSYLSLTWSKIAAKNLYFDVTPGRYSGPWGTFDNKLDYEWMGNFRITGVNKNGEDINDAGFSFPMQLTFFDTYPHWYNHTITFMAILEYGKYVHGWFGSHWEDVHELHASVVLYVIPEGGD